MRSYQVTEFGKPLELKEYENPVPKGTEVLIRIIACGVCHSDIHLTDGFFDLGNGKRITLADRGTKLPFTPGHEITGKVLSIGENGVGKSTVSSNLAVALASKGKKIGLLDADIYGPSQPRMMGVSERPRSPDGKRIIPYKMVYFSLN